MLRSEIGLSSYQILHKSQKTFVFKEALSYVNKTGFGIGKVDNIAIIGGAPATLDVNSFTHSQNLISPTMELLIKWDSGLFFTALYEGEFGSSYRSNEVVIKFGYFF